MMTSHSAQRFELHRLAHNGYRHTVQLISKLTLACGNTCVVLYFCRVTRTKLACDTRVIFCAEHASSISCAARDPSSCAA